MAPAYNPDAQKLKINLKYTQQDCLKKPLFSGYELYES